MFWLSTFFKWTISRPLDLKNSWNPFNTPKSGTLRLGAFVEVQNRLGGVISLLETLPRDMEFDAIAKARATAIYGTICGGEFAWPLNFWRVNER